ncbi:MAG: hypothetical protein AAFY78_03970 [Cyanobacteria bacterium J06648_16]
MTSAFTPQERMESVKAGAIAAATACLTSLAWNGALIASGWASPSETQVLDVAVTTFCGFLFGVTYRYIIRQDVRSHLKSGAVGAFALVRGLSQLEGSWQGGLTWIDGLPLVESFVVFALTQLVLDWSIQQRLIRPFG